MAKLGEAPKHDLVLYHGADFGLDIKWWATSAKDVGVNIAAVKAEVTVDGEVITDLATGAVIAGNVAQLRRDKAIISLLEPTERAKWKLIITSADGQDKPAAEGEVSIRA